MTTDRLDRPDWDWAHGVMVPWGRVLSTLAALTLAALAAGCGGGSLDAPAPGGASASLRADTLPSAPGSPAPGLVPGDAVLVSSTGGGGNCIVLSIDATADGGHAVAWLQREPHDTDLSWTLRVRYFDEAGRPRGDPLVLPYAPDVPNPTDVAAMVRRDGSVVVAWVVERMQDPTPPATLASRLMMRRFDASGTPLDAEVLLDSAFHDPLQAQGKTLQTPSLAQWDDGTYLVGWHGRRLDGPPFVNDSERVQRVEADGRLLRPMDRFFGGAAPMLRLTPLDEGGWIAHSLGGDFASRLFARIVQLEMARPLGLPLLEELPPQSFLMDLQGAGAVLFAGHPSGSLGGLVAPYAQTFDRDGREVGPPTPMAMLPGWTVPLADGGYVAIWPWTPGQPFDAQRYSARGEPLGSAFQLPVSEVQHATRRTQGGMVLAWVDHLPGGEVRLLTQRWLEPGG